MPSFCISCCQDKHEEGIEDCSKALEIHPQYLKALVRRAELYEKSEKFDEALADYNKAVEIDPSQPMYRAHCMVSDFHVSLFYCGCTWLVQKKRKGLVWCGCLVGYS